MVRLVLELREEENNFIQWAKLKYNLGSKPETVNYIISLVANSLDEEEQKEFEQFVSMKNNVAGEEGVSNR